MAYLNPIPTDYIRNMRSQFVNIGGQLSVELTFQNNLPPSRTKIGNQYITRFYLSKMSFPNTPENMELASRVSIENAFMVQLDSPDIVFTDLSETPELGVPLIDGDLLSDLITNPGVSPIFVEITTKIHNGVQRLVDTRHISPGVDPETNPGNAIQGDTIYMYRMIYTFNNAVLPPLEQLDDPDIFGQVYAFTTNWIITTDLNSLDALEDVPDPNNELESFRISLGNDRLIVPYENFIFRGPIDRVKIEGNNEQYEFVARQIADITNDAEATLIEVVEESSIGDEADDLINAVIIRSTE